MNSIAFAVIVLVVLGLAGGIILVLASKFMAVYEDPRIAQITECLAGANCGGCGYAGCADYAKAIVENGAPTNKCAPGGAKATEAVNAIMGTESASGPALHAVVNCNGGNGNCGTRFEYHGIPTCAAAAAIAGGPSACAFGCLGYGDCTRACQFDAIHVVNGSAVVDREKCTGCSACVAAYMTAKTYGGKFNLRFDDTNPAREGDEYVQSILKDLEWLGATPNGGIFYGSDYFEKCYEYAEKLIQEGKAYVDDLTREEMQEYRGNDAGKPSRPSPYRDRTPEENLDLFRRMRAGEFADGEKTLRAKIDLASPNMNLRDPAIYRIKHVSHHRQGDKWCIYPLYDFAHPIQDAIEGITHSMCSLEFENHRPLYEWVVTNIFGAGFPKQREFARLNVTNTVMSKRYLRELVEKNIVDGWDDPRMPTLCGLRRRGYTPTSIFEFVRTAGVAKADSLVDMRQLEAVLRAELELNAARRVAVLEPVKLVIDNYPADQVEYFDLPNNPNRDANDTTTRPVAFTKEVWIDKSDFFEVPPPKFKRLTLGSEVRLMGAYLVRCTGVDKDEAGNVVTIHAEADLETRNGNPADGRKVRGTIHWVSCEHCVDAEIHLYDKLFTEANMNGIPDGADFKDYLNPDSVQVIDHAKLEESLADAKPGERFQFVRTGYFTPDSKNPHVYNRIVTLKDSFKF